MHPFQPLLIEILGKISERRSSSKIFYSIGLYSIGLRQFVYEENLPYLGNFFQNLANITRESLWRRSAMSQSLRIEAPELHSLLTTRTRNSELWFTNQEPFEKTALGYLAKYQETYGVELYAFTFQGNHHQSVAKFPGENRAKFMRDFNSITARVANSLIPGRPQRGSLWGRRYSEEKLPNREDIERYFFYCALQAVYAGLCENPFSYPGYNSFHDAISGKSRTFKVVDRARYNDRRRWDTNVKIEDFTKTVTLTFKRLPGYEQLTQAEYKSLMLKKLETLRKEIVAERKAKGLGFLGRKAILTQSQTPGALPKETKLSTRDSHRPLVLTKCLETKRRMLEWYFSIKAAHMIASDKFRRGINDAIFPPQTYKPPAYAGSG